jgi:hypothetical protein
MTVGGDVLARSSTPADVVADARRHAAGSITRVVAALPVAVTDDPDAARAAAEEGFGRSNGMENYRRPFEWEGVSSVGDLAVVGTEADVEKQLRRYAVVGVTDLWPAVFPAGGTRTHALLAGL